MDSQDSGHMYFTNLFSQDPQLDPTYGGQSGTYLVTLDDSPPLPPKEPIGVKKSVRVDSVFDLEADHVMENEVIEPDRPMGRKAEKGKRKAQGQHAEENFQLKKMKYTLLEESRAQEKEFFRLKAEKMVYHKETEARKLRQEDERLRLEAEKVELVKKESDQRIMMMDVSVMPELQRQFFQQLQREVMARRSRSDDLD
ncbi:hypothetical protein CIPAW_01G084700 [Carya illinoinensis]|uniref:No apical meristem-associated C-terminal domain-containing protein n=1 Tax=Carya illinoinensis TaxID=32201 RepID=A0A8T1RK89_CARIL|nr:hypothetical protein CIPAW_01G084700 [Carya illinoinensis]